MMLRPNAFIVNIVLFLRGRARASPILLGRYMVLGLSFSWSLRRLPRLSSTTLALIAIRLLASQPPRIPPSLLHSGQASCEVTLQYWWAIPSN